MKTAVRDFIASWCEAGSVMSTYMVKSSPVGSTSPTSGFFSYGHTTTSLSATKPMAPPMLLMISLAWLWFMVLFVVSHTHVRDVQKGRTLSGTAVLDR